MANPDPTRLSSPQLFLWRMVIFLAITALIAVILYRQIASAFAANPFLNALIGAVLLIGIIFALLQVGRLFREVLWVNSYRGQISARHQPVPAPIMLAPMAALLGERADRIALGTSALRSILDSIGTRLDEDRDVSRYLTGLLVFLGLLGTFWGLTETVSSIGKTIQSLDMRGGELGVVFEELKTGLAAPLAGMGTAFSSSLFGLAGSLVLGFLDLQAGQAQNRFYKELEEWLSTLTELAHDLPTNPASPAPSLTYIQTSIDRLSRTIAQENGGRAQAAMGNLAEGIQGLVQHMRSEQQQLRDWMEAHTHQQHQMLSLLQKMSENLEKPPQLPPSPPANKPE